MQGRRRANSTLTCIAVPAVTATANVGGRTIIDYNQMAREFDEGNASRPTLIADRVTARSEKSGKALPNGNVATAHAETGVIQQAHDAGLAAGAEMKMSVTGKDVCGYCKGDIAAAARAAGLKSLTIMAVDKDRGIVREYYWIPGMRSIEEKRL